MEIGAATLDGPQLAPPFVYGEEADDNTGRQEASRKKLRLLIDTHMSCKMQYEEPFDGPEGGDNLFDQSSSALNSLGICLWVAHGYQI